MAILNKTFSFLSNTENWIGTNIGSGTTSYTNQRLQISTNTGRNNSTTSKWTWTGTWQDLGVPTGAEITFFQVDFYGSVPTYNVVSYANIYFVSVLSGVDNLNISWTPTGVVSNQLLSGNGITPATPLAASSQVIFDFRSDLRNGNDKNAACTVAMDEVTINITYQTPATPITINAEKLNLSFNLSAPVVTGSLKVTVPIEQVATLSAMQQVPQIIAAIDGFLIERKIGLAGSWQSLNATPVSITDFTDSSSFTPGETYYYRVKRVIGTNESNWSNEVSVQYLTGDQSISINAETCNLGLILKTIILAGPTPTILNLIYSTSKISAVLGKDECSVSFYANHSIQEWEARATQEGVTPQRGVGLLVGSGFDVVQGNEINFIIENEELTLGDRLYTISIYLKIEGVWY